MLKWIEKFKGTAVIEQCHLKVYPNTRGCVKANMERVRPEQLPPLMVRKAAWRR